MELLEHTEYLECLKSLVAHSRRESTPFGTLGLAIPKRQGAFYFGDDLSLDEYISRYQEQINLLNNKKEI